MADQDEPTRPRRALPSTDPVADPDTAGTDTAGTDTGADAAAPAPARRFADSRDGLTHAANTSSVQSVSTPARRVDVSADAGDHATDDGAQATTDAAGGERRHPAARPLTRRQKSATAATPTTLQPGDTPPAPVLPTRDSAASPAGESSAASPPPMWEPRRHAMDKRTRTSLLLAGVAAALVAVLAVGYALWALGNRQPSAASSPIASAVPKSTAPADPLNDADLLTDTEARSIDAKAGWKVALTQDGTNADSPQPLCITQTIEGAPTPLMTKLRTLTSAATTQAQALHQADAYASADEAKQIFEARLSQLGTCADTPAYLAGGLDVTGVGNQAGGVVAVIQNQKLEYHTIVLARTGKVVNTIDVYTEGKPVDGKGVAAAAAAVVNDQCTQAVGLCSFKPAATPAPPPAGGDQPGFLANTDIPRINDGMGEWAGTNPGTQINVIGSACESVDFNTVDGPTARKARTYLLRNDEQAPQNFGIDQVVLTMSDAKAADAFVQRISKNLSECQKRALTATVSQPRQITGTGADQVAVKGQAFTVTQKTDNGAIGFRTAIVSAGNKVVYLVAPGVDKTFDFADAEWDGVALRAAQRTTQVR